MKKTQNGFYCMCISHLCEFLFAAVTSYQGFSGKTVSMYSHIVLEGESSRQFNWSDFRVSARSPGPWEEYSSFSGIWSFIP